MRHLRIYRAIRLIQRTGSIRKAAELLAISPSALNRSVQGFEEELGLPVFDRVTGGVRLTSAGELLLDLLDRHMTEFDDFRTQLV
ncbi:LysR family transcriptional regulator, partial [Roseicyclus sp.]|uniref:LysR family transcriptional regulator n=1 Tax=Roseicyclus sp. TaxID=1914329 RepID=UPI003FA10D69